MTRKYRTSKGGHTQVQSYVKRSSELWRYALEAHEHGHFDACAVNAIHSCISLADAACIAHGGSRYSGTSHDEAVQYFHDLHISDENFKRACRRFGQMIGEKTTAEYGERNLSQKEAESIYKNGERFREYLFSTILSGFRPI